MVDAQETPAQDFKEAAAAKAVPQEIVPIPFDVDVLEWMRGHYGDVPRGINELCRFYMDMNQTRDHDAQPGMWEPGEMEEQPADSIPPPPLP